MNPHTGAVKWYFQFTPHDTANRDAVEPPVLVNTTFHGRPMKLLLHADRNGFFYVFDRTSGKLLLTKPFVTRINWARHRHGGFPLGTQRERQHAS